MNLYKKPIIAFFAMLLIQAVVSVAVLIPGAIYEFMQMAADGQQPNPDVLIERLTSGSSFISIALIVSSIITIFFMQTPMKMIRLKDSFAMPKISLGKSLYLVLAAFIGIFATDVVSEVMDLPNIIEAELGGMSKTVMGVLAIAIIGPLAEEVVFRGAIQQHLHMVIRLGKHLLPIAMEVVKSRLLHEPCPDSICLRCGSHPRSVLLEDWQSCLALHHPHAQQRHLMLAVEHYGR